MERSILDLLPPVDANRAAVLYAALRLAALQFIESDTARYWLRGRSHHDAVELLRQLCSRFHSYATQLQSRGRGRAGWELRDEYDVQDAMHALLRLHFDDVRPEETTPSYGSKSARMDFLLKQEKIVIETKMTRDNLGPKEVADELIIDKERYRSHPDCQTLVCFVYDPNGRCVNPSGLENDLSSSDQSFEVHVIVVPKRM